MKIIMVGNTNAITDITHIRTSIEFPFSEEKT